MRERLDVRTVTQFESPGNKLAPIQHAFSRLIISAPVLKVNINTENKHFAEYRIEIREGASVIVMILRLTEI